MFHSVLRPVECLRSSVRLAPGPAGTLRFWHRRSSSVVSSLLPLHVTRWTLRWTDRHIIIAMKWFASNIQSFFRVTLYSEFLPVKARGTCIMLISVLTVLLLLHDFYCIPVLNLGSDLSYCSLIPSWLMCLCASGILGYWCCVRGPPGIVDNAHTRVEVAARPVRYTNGNLCLLLLCKYVGDY